MVSEAWEELGFFSVLQLAPWYDLVQETPADLVARALHDLAAGFL